MMIDLKDLKENFNLESAFNLSESKEYVGELEGGKEVLDRISLVLTQTFDAIGSLPFRQLVVKGKEKKVVIFYYRNNFFGIVTNKSENVENVLKYIYEKESEERVKARGKEKKIERAVVEEREKVEAEKVEKEAIVEEEVKTEKVEKEEVEAKEAKAEVIEAEKVEEKKVEVEEVKEVSVPKVVLNSKIIDDIEEIAGNYLGDFSLDIVSNVIEDSGINREEPIKDQVLEVAQSLKDAASLIVGPSKAKKLKEDIMKKIEEVE
jgi:hypothetical protein